MVSAFTAAQLRPAIIDFYILSQGVPASFRDDGRLRDYRTDLINRWRRTLLRDIEFCIACELRHINDGRGKPLPSNLTWAQWFQKHFGEVGGLWYSKYHAVLKQGRKTPPVTGNEDFNEDVSYVMQAHDLTGGRGRSYVASKCAEAQHGLSLIEVCNRAYDTKNSRWRGSFGGSRWHLVAKTLFDLWLATDSSEIMRLIDTAFALQHNTAIVFNKNQIWRGVNQYKWIMETLDAKWTAVSPESLLGYASNPLKDVVRANGFRRSFEIPPKNISIEPFVGMQAVLRDGSSSVPVRVSKVVGDYFKSITVESPEFSIHKQAGKYSKTVHFKIYSLAEFLYQLKSLPPPDVDLVKMPVQGSKAQYAKDIMEKYKSLKKYDALMSDTKKAQAKSDFSVHMNPVHKAAVASAYEALMDYVHSKGFSLGELLENGNKVRFRLKGHPKPLRFYFSCIGDKLKCSVGYTDKIGAAQHGETFSKPSGESILSFLKGKVDAHIGG